MIDMTGLDGIVNIYKEQVEEKDKKGFADAYKKAAKNFFRGLKKLGFNVVKPEYLDGYFIFGSGTNSVVHFHIKEIPGWRFGIWWKTPDDTNYVNGKLVDIRGELFTQYEETIDKFKPSASSITSDIYVSLEHTVDSFFLKRMLTFMRDEPEICFCRDYCYWDEWEYHTREEAKKKFNEYKKKDDLKKKYSKIFEDKYKALAKDICKYIGKGAKIRDCGDCIYPRYDIICKMPNKKLVVDEPGCYSLFYNTEDEELKKFEKRWDKINDELEKVSSKYDIYLSPSNYFHRVVNMYAPQIEPNDGGLEK